MRAAVIERYGPPEVVRIAEVPTPVPGADEVLIRSVATTVNSGDARLRAMRVPRGMTPLVRLAMGVTKPRRPVAGFDVAGVVESVGSAVSELEPGDRVAASRGFAFGCHAERVVVGPKGAIAKIPEGITETDAVSVCFGGVTALQFFRLGKVAPGDTVLVNGASGAVGTMAVQIAKHLGAEVTGVCSTANVELVTGLGADRVIDYTKGDVLGDGRRYDVIMDNQGNLPYTQARGSLEPDGRHLMIVGDLWQTISASWQKAVVPGGRNRDMLSSENFRTILSLVDRGAVKPVIDRVLPFEEIVEAHRRVDTDHKVGSVVVTFGPPPEPPPAEG
jgi:NADPH:quinone reductase-like Zn-dependent oxidoreductase